MKRFLLRLMMMGALCGAGPVAGADGMPLPWPFPWAKDCSIDWTAVTGRYQMADTDASAEIQVSISVVEYPNIRLLRIYKYDDVGRKVASGLAVLTEGQRTVRLFLLPLDRKSSAFKATLKFYHSNWGLYCDQAQLVPILSLVEVGTEAHAQSNYRLIPLDGSR